MTTGTRNSPAASAALPGPGTRTAKTAPADAAEHGLYQPAREHDACGVGFIAHLKGKRSHQIVRDGLQILENLTHRGAVGADPLVGDGAGMILQIPHEFFAEHWAEQGVALPTRGHYAVGHIFMPQDADLRSHCERIVEQAILAEGQTLIGWRDVPVDNSCLSTAVLDAEPVHRQVFIGRGDGVEDQATFERRLYILRKVISNTTFRETDGRDNGFYIVSLSSRTMCYKGMFPCLSARRLFQGPDRRTADLGAGAGSPAVLHQHLPVVETRPPLPHGRP